MTKWRNIYYMCNDFFLIFIEVQLIYNVRLVSSVQQSDSVLFQILFRYRLLQDIE